MKDEATHPVIQSSVPIREFHDLGEVAAVAVFPDRRRMATNSSDGMLRIWDLKNGTMLKELEGRSIGMGDMAISRDGQLIARSDRAGYVTAWHGDTGRPLTQSFQPHPSHIVCSLDFSPDGATLATGSSDCTVKLWSTDTWQLQGTSFNCGSLVTFIRYSSSHELLAIATNKNIQVWNPAGRLLTEIYGEEALSGPLVWTPDGKFLLSRTRNDSTIQEWDSSTWKQVGNIWKGDSDNYKHFAVNCNGTMIASITKGNHVRLWRFLDRRTIAIFRHSGSPCCVTFSIDGKHLLVGGVDKKISQWAVPEHAWPEHTPKEQATYQVEVNDTEASDTDVQGYETEILAMKSAVRNACIIGDLPTAEELLIQEIEANGDNHRSYASRSVVMARKLDWDRALHDATKSPSIQPSLMGYISKGIALCGKTQIKNASKALDLAFTFANGESKTIYFIFLVKAVAFFNANQHSDAIRRVRELAATCPNADITLTCHIVEVYLHIQLGNKALDRACPAEAADHFTAAVNTGTFLTKSPIDSNYEDFAVLFGCDFTSLWQTANQKRCHALLRAGRLVEVFDAVQYMADMSDEAMKASCLDWSIGLMRELSTFRDNAPNANATSIPDMSKYGDDESVSISDIDHVDDVVC